MKPINYKIERAADVANAVARLKADEFAQPIAGGQSLGPMLNLRLARPECVIDISRIPALTQARIEDEELVIGAMVTHAAVEDGVIPDVTRGFLPYVARGISYRAVRNSGTLGGSLCHADPAADWVSALAVAGAQLDVEGPDGGRGISAAQFVTSAFETQLNEAEVLVRIRVPRLSDNARWSYRKFCRKRGEFALAITSAVYDPIRQVERLVFGALDRAPVVLERSGLFDDLQSADARVELFDSTELQLTGHRRALHADLLVSVLDDLKGAS